MGCGWPYHLIDDFNPGQGSSLIMEAIQPVKTTRSRSIGGGNEPTAVPPAAILHDDPKQKKKASKQQPQLRTPTVKQVSLFSHLPQYERADSMTAALTSRPLLREAIHPAIIRLALLFANYRILGASRRCLEMMKAFKEVIRDYQGPVDQMINRHLAAHLGPQIAFLVQARPLAVPMGHAIRLLKLRISQLAPECTELQAKQTILEYLDHFISHRLEAVDPLIVQNGLRKIERGDVILTFGRSQVVRDLLLAAHAAGREIRVVLVDGRPFLEGRRLLDELSQAGIRCQYVPINALSYVMREVTKTIIGAHCIYSNGALMSRVGTAMVCHLSRRANVPVLACCQTLKFSERVQLDAFVFNEIGDPDALVRQPLRPSQTQEPLAGWREVSPLKLLNILYDVTPPEHVNMVVTEYGNIPVTSIPVVIREYNLSQTI